MKTSNPTSKALVFDLKRFAVHDGKGLRTTVFFKGCPLRCKWCQNPEGLEARQKPIFLKKQCIGCQTCLHLADQGQVSWKDGHPILNYQSPKEFGAIIDACPARAIRYDSTAYSVEELLKRIQQDQVFFRQEGGVTFSGGEPFMQGQYLIEILKACKQAGIDTAIESSFYADPHLVHQAVELLDHIFCDIKLFDGSKHEQATGVNNGLILDNIAWMLADPEIARRVIVRTPLIPGWSATQENIAAIADWLVQINPDTHWELLNYNPLAPAKYEMTGQTWSLDGAKPLTRAELETLYQTARDHGITNLVME